MQRNCADRRILQHSTADASPGRTAESWLPSAITRWQYVKQAGENAFETAWTDVPHSGERTTTHTVTGLISNVSPSAAPRWRPVTAATFAYASGTCA